MHPQKASHPHPLYLIAVVLVFHLNTLVPAFLTTLIVFVSLLSTLDFL